MYKHACLNVKTILSQKDASLYKEKKKNACAFKKKSRIGRLAKLFIFFFIFLLVCF